MWDSLPNIIRYGNEADFMGFLHKSIPRESFTPHFEPFRFWLRIREDIRNRKTTPRLAESGSRQDFLELPFFPTFKYVIVHYISFVPIGPLKGWFSCLKVHKNENFFGSDFEFCTISLLVMLKY
jgi:hypothetical protein